MKYVLLFVETEEFEHDLEAMDPQEHARAYQRVMDWMATHAEKITGGNKLAEYHLYHATRAELLRELGHPGQARAADRRALELTANPAERAVLRQRLALA